MISTVIYCIPVFDNAFFVKGFRSCVANVPGCSITLEDRNKAVEIMKATHQALMEEEKGIHDAKVN